MKYHVDVREILIKGVDIEANSIEEAKQKTKEMYDNEEILLGWEDFNSGDTSIRVFDENYNPLEEWDDEFNIL